MELQQRKISQLKAVDGVQEEITEQDTDKQSTKPLNKQQEETYLSFTKSLLRVINLCLSSFYFGYTLAYLGAFNYSTIITLYDIQKDKQTVQGLLQGIVSIGAGIGAVFSSFVLKSFSRKNSVIFTNVIAFICGIIVLIPNLYVFFVIRFLQGACIGLYSAIIPLLIKQYSPNEICGIFGAFNQIFIAFGVFFAFVFQLILIQFNSQLEHWRIVFGLTLITIAIQTLLLIFIYKEETPKYLLLNGREEECRVFISNNYKQKFILKILRQKQSDIGILNHTESEIKKSKQNYEEPGNTVMCIDLDLKRGRKIRIMAAIHLAVLQQFVGINSVVAYGVDIVAQILPSMAKIIPAVLNLQSVIAGIVSSFLLAKLGRKIILQAGTLFATISLILVAIGFWIKDSSSATSNVLVILGLVIFMANFGLSLGPVTWLYIAEIVEPEIIPFSTMSNWATASIVIITFPILSVAFGTPVPLFFFFAVWSAVSLFVNSKLLLQTKGKTEKQIRQEYCRV